MKLEFSKKALDAYLTLSLTLRVRADKQFAFLVRNLRHPSLRAKKYSEQYDIWQARLTREYRFYFRIVGDTYEIVTIRRHPK